MKRLLVVLVLLVAGVAGLGLYLGWFKVGSESGDGKSRITLTVDKDKIQADEKTAVEKVEDLTGHGKDKAGATTEKSKE